MVTNKKVESTKTLDKETMVTFTNEDFAKALAKRNVKTEEAFCLPLAAGNFGIEDQAVTPVPQYMIYHGKVAYSPSILQTIHDKAQCLCRIQCMEYAV